MHFTLLYLNKKGRKDERKEGIIWPEIQVNCLAGNSEESVII